MNVCLVITVLHSLKRKMQKPPPSPSTKPSSTSLVIFPASARPTHSVLKYLPPSCLCLIPLINTLPGIRGRLIDFELFLKVVLLINM